MDKKYGKSIIKRTSLFQKGPMRINTNLRLFALNIGIKCLSRYLE